MHALTIMDSHEPSAPVCGYQCSLVPSASFDTHPTAKIHRWIAGWTRDKGSHVTGSGEAPGAAWVGSVI